MSKKKRCKLGVCELCKRDDMELTFHHLIPVTNHKNKWFKKNFTREEMNTGADLCSDCHGNIHRFINEKELGKHFNTIAKLLENEDVSKFVQWVSKR